MADIEIKRGYEVLPDNRVRFGIRIINNGDSAISEVEVILDFSSSLFELEGNKIGALGTIPPSIVRTAKFILKPLSCVHNEKIEAIVRYKDYKWVNHTIEMRPKEVHCVCPFLKEKIITRTAFLKLFNEGYAAESGLNFENIRPEEVIDFITHTCKNRLHKVDEFPVENGKILYLAGDSPGEKAHYLLTAVVIEREGLVQVLFKAKSDKEFGINGFLNEVVENLRHLVESSSAANEIGIIKREQVINIIDSVVVRPDFDFEAENGKKEQEEKLRSQKEENERLKKEKEERDRKPREEKERLESERKQREEEDRKKKEDEERLRKQKEEENKKKEALERKQREEQERKTNEELERKKLEEARKIQAAKQAVSHNLETKLPSKEPESSSGKKALVGIGIILGIFLILIVAMSSGSHTSDVNTQQEVNKIDQTKSQQSQAISQNPPQASETTQTSSSQNSDTYNSLNAKGVSVDENTTDASIDENVTDENAQTSSSQNLRITNYLIRLANYRAVPSSLSIREGETVAWRNLQDNPKRNFILVSQQNLFENKTLVYGSSFAYTFNEPGDYNFIVIGQPRMNVSVSVMFPNNTSY